MLSMKTLIPVTLVFAGVVACGSNPGDGTNSSTSSAVRDNGGNGGAGGETNNGGGYNNNGGAGGGVNNGGGYNNNGGAGGGDNGGDHGCDLKCPDGLVGGHIDVDLAKATQPPVKLDDDGSVTIKNDKDKMTTTWDSGDTDIALIIVHDGKRCDQLHPKPPHTTEGTVTWDGKVMTAAPDSVVVPLPPQRDLVFCIPPKGGKTW